VHVVEDDPPRAALGEIEDRFDECVGIAGERRPVDSFDLLGLGEGAEDLLPDLGAGDRRAEGVS
jgi:hypothetical protein